MPQIIERARNNTSHILELADAELVLTVRQWATLVSFGYSTAKSLLRAGRGPKVTRLTDRRIGIRMSSHAAWLAARTEA